MDESSLEANYFNYFLTQSLGLSAAAYSTAWQLPAPYVPPFPKQQVPQNPSCGLERTCWSGWVVVRSHHDQGQGAKWFLKTCPRCWFNMTAPPQDNPEHPFLLQKTAQQKTAQQNFLA